MWTLHFLLPSLKNFISNCATSQSATMGRVAEMPQIGRLRHRYMRVAARLVAVSSLSTCISFAALCVSLTSISERICAEANELGP